MNVLSLFDGMSCGQLALQKAGVKYDKYYASEIDKYAIQITQKNYPETVQVGDITKLKGSDYPDIDLLIGGSPCQGFSLAGKQLNFQDSRSALFFEYLRVLKEVNPKYFLLENVKMNKAIQDRISELVGVEPVFINSKLFSAQNRPRLYWTNIEIPELPEDQGLLIKDVLEPEGIDITERYYAKREGTLALTKALSNTRTINQKAKCLTTGGQSISNTGATNVKISDSLIRKLTPLECERLQTVPEGYTEGVSNTQRYRMLGNGWTVDVIAHIFSGMKTYSNIDREVLLSYN